LKFTILSHASMLVEGDGGSILFDPWLIGSCYWRSWWNFPEPPAEMLASLRPDFIYLTHLHWDHFHAPSLKLFDRDTRIVVPFLPTTRMLRDLKSMKMRNVIEVPHGGSIPLWRGCELTAYHFGLASTDSAAVISDGRTTLLNANDCKIFGSSLKQLTTRFPRVDFCFRSHSSASATPFCIEDYERHYPNARRAKDSIEDFCNFAELVGARYAIPFASNHCFVHRDTLRYNETAANPAMVKETFDRRAAERKLESRCVVMTPGSSWSTEEGFKLVPFDYSKRNEYVAGLLEKYTDKFSAQYAKEEGQRADWIAFERYFNKLIRATPKLLRRAVSRFAFEAVEAGGRRLFLVDFPAGRVAEVTQLPEVAFVVRTPALVLNDCVKKRMFSVWSASKRLSIRLGDGNARRLAVFFQLLDLYENDGLPLRNLFTVRQLKSRLPRWREGLDLLGLAVKIKILRRSFRLGDVYAPPGRGTAAGR
jgi:UDP-MurNAc hydroxylase